jgi:sigma-E factor negative regulatory protein RseB
MTEAGAGGAAVRAWLLLGATLLAVPALGDDEARQWLAGMTEALASRNYQGEFLHLANGHVEKLRILHRVKDGRVAERLVSLSGNGREVVRSDAEVQCYLPDERKVVVESRADHGPLLGTLPTFDDSLEANYRLTMDGRARSVIGRDARIVAVSPRDGYRFGYRVWIDEETRMPVRTDLCDANGAVLEQVLFTSLRVGGVLPDSAFRPGVQADGYTWVRQAAAGSLRNPADELPWRLLRLPPGFRVSSSGQQLLPGNDRPVTHLVLSDGLASVSVFIEGPPAAPRRPTEGQGRVGSAFAYSKYVGGHQVTAVGEVPPQTVEFIASGIAPAAAPRAGAGLALSRAPAP